MEREEGQGLGSRERGIESDSRVRCELWREQGKGGKDMKTDGLLEV